MKTSKFFIMFEIFVHVILDGKVIKSGDKSLAKKIEDKGYDWLKNEKK